MFFALFYSAFCSCVLLLIIIFLFGLYIKFFVCFDLLSFVFRVFVCLILVCIMLFFGFGVCLHFLFYFCMHIFLLCFTVLFCSCVLLLFTFVCSVS